MLKLSFSSADGLQNPGEGTLASSWGACKVAACSSPTFRCSVADRGVEASLFLVPWQEHWVLPVAVGTPVCWWQSPTAVCPAPHCSRAGPQVSREARLGLALSSSAGFFTCAC